MHFYPLINTTSNCKKAEHKATEVSKKDRKVLPESWSSQKKREDTEAVQYPFEVHARKKFVWSTNWNSINRLPFKRNSVQPMHSLEKNASVYVRSVRRNLNSRNSCSTGATGCRLVSDSPINHSRLYQGFWRNGKRKNKTSWRSERCPWISAVCRIFASDESCGIVSTTKDDGMMGWLLFFNADITFCVMELLSQGVGVHHVPKVLTSVSQLCKTNSQTAFSHNDQQNRGSELWSC